LVDGGGVGDLLHRNGRETLLGEAGARFFEDAFASGRGPARVGLVHGHDLSGGGTVLTNRLVYMIPYAGLPAAPRDGARLPARLDGRLTRRGARRPNDRGDAASWFAYHVEESRMPLHVAILTMSGYGHVNPFLPIAAEHVRRGDRVTFAVGERFAADVRAAGAELLPYGEDLMAQRREAAPSPEAMQAFFARMREEVRDAIGQVLATGPDVVIYDALLQLFGIPEVREMDAPRVALSPTFALPDGVSIGEMFSRMGFRGLGGKRGPMLTDSLFDLESAFRAEPLTLVTIPKSYQPGGE